MSPVSKQTEMSDRIKEKLRLNAAKLNGNTPEIFQELKRVKDVTKLPKLSIKGSYDNWRDRIETHLRSMKMRDFVFEAENPFLSKCKKSSIAKNVFKCRRSELTEEMLESSDYVQDELDDEVLLKVVDDHHLSILMEKDLYAWQVLREVIPESLSFLWSGLSAEDLGDSRKAWKAVESHYRRNDAESVLRIMEQFIDAKQKDNQSVLQFMSDISRLHERLLESKVSMEDLSKLIMIRGFSSRYGTTRNLILEANDISNLTIDNIQKKFTLAESRSNVQASKDGRWNESLASRRQKHSSMQQKLSLLSDGEGHPKRGCWNCGISGHIWSRCTKPLKPELEERRSKYEKGRQSLQKTQNSSKLSALAEAMNRVEAMLSKKQKKKKKDKQGGNVISVFAEDDEEKSNQDFQLSAEPSDSVQHYGFNAAVRHGESHTKDGSNDTKLDEWVVDSGGSTNFGTDQLDIVEDVCSWRNDKTVCVETANGTTTSTAVGTYYGTILNKSESLPSTTIKIKEIHRLPKLQRNLLSVAALVRAGLYVGFNEDGVEIRDKDSNGTVLSNGEFQNGLFVLKVRRNNPEEEKLLCSLIARSGPLKLFHDRWGHCSEKTIRDTISSIPSITLSGNRTGKKDFIKCCDCQVANIKNCSHPPSKNAKSSVLLGVLHFDTDVADVLSVDGIRCVLNMVEESTRYSVSVLQTRRKRSDETIIELVELCEKQHNENVRRIHLDSAPEFLTTNLKEYVQRRNILLTTSLIGQSEQNGLVERRHQTLQMRARAMRVRARMPASRWDWAYLHASHITNMLIQTSTGNVPYEQWFQKKNPIGIIPKFGCRAVVKVADKSGSGHKKASTCRNRGEKGIFIGMCYPSMKGYKIWVASRNIVIESCDCWFDEDEFPYSQDVANLELNTGPDHQCVDEDETDWFESSSEQYTSSDTSESSDSSDDCCSDSEGSEAEDAPDNSQNQEHQVQVSPARGNNNIRRSKRLPKQPGEWWKVSTMCDVLATTETSLSEMKSSQIDFNSYLAAIRTNCEELIQACVAWNTNEELRVTPKNRKEAISHPEWAEIYEAEQTEIQTLLYNDTWELVEPHPSMKIIGTMWQYAQKLDDNRNFSFWKARLVARGDQVATTDLETYAHTLSHAGLRIFFAIVARENYIVRRYDVSGAYLYAEYPDEAEPIYIRQPPGHLDRNKPGYVCRLKKSLYGIPPAGRLWEEELSSTLVQMGYRRLIMEPSIFTLKSSDGTEIPAAHYVDDIIAAFKEDDQKSIDWFEECLSAKYKIKKLGRPKSILGLNIEWVEHGIGMHVGPLIEKVLLLYKMHDCKPSKLPMSPGTQLQKLEQPASGCAVEQQQFMESVPYRSLVAVLLYMSVVCRMDISYAVGVLCRYFDGYAQSHWNVAKQVLRYLKGTQYYGLFFRFGSSEQRTIGAWSDTDFAMCPDTRRSTGGYCLQLWGNTVDWMSKRLPLVTLSSCESEFCQLTITGKSVVWCRMLLEELGYKIEKGSTIYEDNQGAIKIARSRIINARTKHIDYRFRWICEMVEKNQFELRYCPTEEMIADILTKPLPAVRLKKLLFNAGMRDFGVKNAQIQH